MRTLRVITPYKLVVAWDQAGFKEHGSIQHGVANENVSVSSHVKSITFNSCKAITIIIISRAHAYVDDIKVTYPIPILSLQVEWN